MHETTSTYNRTYFLASRFELHAVVLGGLLSLLSQFLPELRTSITVLLLAIILFYEYAFPKTYMGLAGRTWIYAIAIIVCAVSITLTVFHVDWFYMMSFIVIESVVRFVFWVGFVFEFMARSGMRRWIPALFCYLMMIIHSIITQENQILFAFITNIDSLTGSLFRLWGSSTLISVVAYTVSSLLMFGILGGIIAMQWR
ncbi:MAG: hypothetical protein JNL32_08315 [Candidatus Kapabacteria bacterium]|nr:hypothetical protein [Candidatus Kapabacteria bacterium]